jgi:hypothetical protein
VQLAGAVQVHQRVDELRRHALEPVEIARHLPRRVDRQRQPRLAAGLFVVRRDGQNRRRFLRGGAGNPGP